MERRSLVVGNWKMELSHKAEVETATATKKLLKGVKIETDIVICPSFVSLPVIHQNIQSSDKLQLGAQNIHWEEKGAWTGEVSVHQIRPFATWCIVGHSEQRELTGETDEIVVQKANLLLKYGITPIICIGETAAQRDSDGTLDQITQQVKGIFAASDRMSLAKMVIVYEPIWAIGSGNTPDPEEVTGIILLIRKLAAAKFGNEAAQRLRVIYGGSVKPDTVTPIVSEPGVDGVLVGGASLHPLEFVKIVTTVQEARD